MKKKRGSSKSPKTKPNKKQKRSPQPKCWIESCKGNKCRDPKLLEGAIYVIITRVELNDSFSIDNTSQVTTQNPSNQLKQTNREEVGQGAETQDILKMEQEPHSDYEQKDGYKESYNEKPDIENENEKKQSEKEHETHESEKENHEYMSVKNPESSLEASSDKESGGDIHEELAPGDNFLAKFTDESNTMIASPVPQSDKHNPYVCIRVGSSAKGNMQGFQSYAEYPNGDCGDGICNPYPNQVLDKYWAQRRRLFCKFDEGIQLDTESWYSVTPESIAHHIAQKMVRNMIQLNQRQNKPKQGFVVMDVFCGCGGNSIAFALQQEVEFVVCVDLDERKLEMLANNADIYNVDRRKLLLVQGDAIEIMRDYYQNGCLVTPKSNLMLDEKKISIKSEQDVTQDDQKSADPVEASDLQDNIVDVMKGFKKGGVEILPPRIDAIFLSPPWGGPNYSSRGQSVSLSDCIQVASLDSSSTSHNLIKGDDLICLACGATLNGQHVTLFLPKNVNGYSVANDASRYKGKHLLGGSHVIELEQNVVNGKLKTITAYLGQGRTFDEIN